MSARRPGHRLRDRVIFADAGLAAPALRSLPSLELHLKTSNVAVTNMAASRHIRILRRIRLLILLQLLTMMNIEVPLEALRHHGPPIVLMRRLNQVVGESLRNLPLVKCTSSITRTWRRMAVVAEIGDGDQRLRQPFQHLL